MRYLRVPVVDITEVVPRKKLDPRDFTLARRPPPAPAPAAITVDVPPAEKPPEKPPEKPASAKPAVFDGWDEVFLR